MSALESSSPNWSSQSMGSDISSSEDHLSSQLSLLDSLEYSDGKPSRPRMGRGSRGPRPRLFAKGKCQADGCSVNLSKLPFYYQRNHVCTEHNKCPSFRRQGEEVRYCQRCGVAHPLSDYDGDRRSCRRQLERHNARR